MGRHHKPSDLSSSYPTGFNRSPFTIREVRCCTWWPANKIPSVIPLAVIVCFLICLVWSFRRLPEDHDEYPDGFTCPDSGYKILDYRNVTISCEPCLECPLGQELLPPCGSTTKSETSIECRKCPPDTYKESKGADKCKPCQTCGLRETISQYTPEKNALCGECAGGFYQDDYTIYLKQCVRKNCTKQLKIKQSSVLRSEDSMRVVKLFATESAAHERAVTQRSASQSDNPAPTRDRVLVNTGRSQLKESTIKRKVDVKMLRGDVVRRSFVWSKDSETATIELTEPPMQSAISSDSGNDSKLLTILIVLVGIAIVLILIAIIMAWKNQSAHFPGRSCTVTCCAKHIYFRDVNEYRSLMPDTFQTDSEIAHTSDNGVATSSENAEINYDIENFALCELCPTLENILIKKLDVLHKGEYGWKKLGEAFEIDNDDLTYLETAYKRSVGSPTKELLEILAKNQCRTVGEVLNKLTGSYVNRPDVARLIYQKWQEI